MNLNTLFIFKQSRQALSNIFSLTQSTMTTLTAAPFFHHVAMWTRLLPRWDIIPTFPLSNRSKLFTATTTRLLTELFSTWLCRALFSACGAEAPPSLTSGGGLCRWRAPDISAERTDRGHSQDSDPDRFMMTDAHKNVIFRPVFTCTTKENWTLCPTISPVENTTHDVTFKTHTGNTWENESVFTCFTPPQTHLFSEVLYDAVLGDLRADRKASLQLLLDARDHFLVLLRSEALGS